MLWTSSPLKLSKVLDEARKRLNWFGIFKAKLSFGFLRKLKWWKTVEMEWSERFGLICCHCQRIVRCWSDNLDSYNYTSSTFNRIFLTFLRIINLSNIFLAQRAENLLSDKEGRITLPRLRVELRWDLDFSVCKRPISIISVLCESGPLLNIMNPSIIQILLISDIFLNW